MAGFDDQGNPIPDPAPPPPPPTDADGNPISPPAEPPVEPPPVEPPKAHTLGRDADEMTAAAAAAKASADALAAYKAEVAAKTADMEAAAAADADALAREKSEFAADLKTVGKTLVTPLPDGRFLLRYLVPGSDTITEEVGVGPETEVPDVAPVTPVVTSPVA